jgi:HAD superfamily hydrolase (TIGR01509 family)
MNRNQISASNTSSRCRPKAVVFDLDGLMFNTEELYQYVGGEVLRRRGRQFTSELLDAMMGRPGRVALQIMIDWHRLDATVEELARESNEVFARILGDRLEVMPGLLELLDALEEAGIPKAIATSSGRSFVTDVLSRFDLEPRFQFILTAEDVVEGKPHPEIYRKAAARFGLEPAEVLVLEDSENGCRAAAAAQTFVVAVPAGHSSRHDFSCVSLRIDSLADHRLYEVLGLRRIG